MAVSVRTVEYYYVTVQDRPGQAYRVLSRLASAEINLLAFGCVPLGPFDTQLTLFPDDPGRLANAAERLGLSLVGPHHAFLIQGDDHLGALVEMHRKLSNENINIYASNGVTDGQGGYGYILYVRPEEVKRAAEVLGTD